MRATVTLIDVPGDAHTVALLDRDYADRRFIVIVPDPVARAAQASGTRLSQERIGWAKVLEVGVIVSAAVVPTAALGLAAARAASKARTEGTEVLTVGRSEASSQLKLPPGHPQNEVVYAGHPVVDPVYYTLAHFHRLAFEHKFAEAIQLLMALGATSLHVQSVKGWSQEMAAQVGAAIPGEAVDVGLKVGKRKGAQASALFDATLDGTVEPRIPPSLAWYDHEPTWQQIARGRMDARLRTFSLSVSYEDDFGVNAGLNAKIAGYGLHAGGKFQDHESTLWTISGEFAA